MAELKSEKPSHEELRAYFFEQMQKSAWLLHDNVTDPIYQQTGLGAFILMMTESMFACLSRLNDLPRSHPFWENTNRKPTIFKLESFCSEVLLKENPDDVGALLATAALCFYYGSSDFGQHQWKELKRVGHFEESWPIYAAYGTHACTGIDVSRELVLLSRELQIEESATNLLQTFCIAPNRFMRRFALQAIKECAHSRSE